MEEDLNKEIQRFSMNLAVQENGGEWLHDIMKTARHFAEWQKQQMMANAIEAEVQSAGCFIPLITPKEYGDKIPNIKFGDTIKVILVKE